jgi:hypothetical protein
MSRKSWWRRSPDLLPVRLEDALCALARRKIASGELRRAVWELALRLARADERRAVDAYIRLRVRALLAAHEARQE